WSVLAMLLCLFVQTITGLFTSNRRHTEFGPWALHVPEAWSQWLTEIHKINQNVLLILIGLHIAVVLMYWIGKNENLIGPMLHGRKVLAAMAPPRFVSLMRAMNHARRRTPGQIAARVASIPEITIDESLPIAARADEIAKLIREHPVLVIAGETGSGKTTQLPKLCLAAGRGIDGMIGCTQPRRLAARAMARRVAAELGTEIGGKVGFQVRFDERVGEHTLIKFMTDGILLSELSRDRTLSVYDTIILDEAHERSLNIDFLLGYLKTLLRKRRDLKLIVTSATLDIARFAAHFDDAPVIEVVGRAYPVEVRWREPQRDETLSEQIIAALDKITHEDPRGDALVFLPGEREIRDAHLALNRRN